MVDDTGREGRKQGSKGGSFLTESLVHHGLLLLFLTLFIQQRTEGIPDAERETLALLCT